MQIGIGLELTRCGFGGTGFSPLSLFAGGEQGAWFDASDRTTLFQDVAGTIPITADGQLVALWKDKSGNNNHAKQATSGARPIYRNSGSLAWLELDGVDDKLLTSNIDLTARSQMLVVAGYEKKTSALTFESVFGFGNSGVSGGAEVRISSGNQSTGNVLLRTTGVTGAAVTGMLKDTSEIFSAWLNANSGEYVAASREDDPWAVAAAASGGGGFQNAPMILGAQQFNQQMSGKIYSVIARCAPFSASACNNMRNYVARLQGRGTIATHRLSGVSWTSLGDSITQGVGADSNGSYAPIASAILRTRLVNKGVGGATMAYRASETTLNNSCFSTITAGSAMVGYDVITVAYGTNDAGGAVPMGVLGSTDVATFYGAMEVGYANIVAANPTARVIFIRPIYRNPDPGVQAYRDAITAFCISKGLTYFTPDVDLGINSSNYTTYLGDGLHPNPAGYQLYGNYVAGKMEASL